MFVNPGVPFFISFHDLDPSRQSKCIFFTQKGRRCRWDCTAADNKRAITLRKEIDVATSRAEFRIDLLQEYVLCNCCRAGNARHRDRIEDLDLLLPLAQRWQDEIRRHAAANRNHSFTSLKPYESGRLGTSTTTRIASQPFGNAQRYELRSHAECLSTDPAITRATFMPTVSLSEFRPHITESSPSDTVSYKILEPLKGRDFETGSVYVFDRASSPGHVKIGWTATTVLQRLQRLSSQCGYHPNLVFQVGHIPHAQRAETLAHFELLKEWRRERRCKGCHKSHQEWFEISKERAAQVVGDWAEFMRRAEPYDSDGRLKNMWRDVVESMHRNKEAVTAMELLTRHEESLATETGIVEELANSADASAIQKAVVRSFGPHVGSQDDLKTASMDAVLTRHRETLDRIAGSLLELIADLDPSFLQEAKSCSRAVQFQGRSISYDRGSIKRESTASTHFPSAIKSPLKPEPFAKPGSSAFKMEPLFTRESLVKTERSALASVPVHS